MEVEGGSNSSNYYSVLGICKDASFSEIRVAYRKLALKWHPDRWMKNEREVGEAKQRFQTIQEAYSVLSDQGKRSMYDLGLYDPFEEEDEGLADFIQELFSMMDKVTPEESSYENLEKLYAEMTGGSSLRGNGNGEDDRTAGKRARCPGARSQDKNSGKRATSRVS